MHRVDALLAELLGDGLRERAQRVLATSELSSAAASAKG